MNFWEWFFKSFYSKKVIAYSRFRPITTTIAYVLFIIFIASIPYFISFNASTVTSIQQLERMLEYNSPNFHLKDGALVWEANEPYLLTEFSEGFFLIDPSASFKEEELLTMNEGIALLQNEFLFISDGQTQSVSYAVLGLQELSKEELIERVNQLQSFLPILLIIITALLYVGLAGLAYLGITILAYLALLVKGKRKLEYRHMWIITAHALTMPVILLYWMDTLILSIPFSAFAASTFLIVFLAIRSIPLPKKRQV
ncbi:hypothetical protein JCM9140_702 [Halalkalibacter wakoensis JCM 9140]|uniref:DUF1189 domain-containing protein n=1 Tax=Halalkalibacter wakoensis JCM 9140 TaxID=1236970 RepID=W4PYI6_9BACI|nr:DUF1189 domain-containing protein [Halalkalibacter wakoensis]GAE24750.1 hypothetical protein JCM9140_702 [Halalkalibacter wakoensis JCM 9140]